MNPRQQVEHLKSRGVIFELMSEVEAERYLASYSNCFRLRSYRTGFAKVIGSWFPTACSPIS